MRPHREIERKNRGVPKVTKKDAKMGEKKKKQRSAAKRSVRSNEHVE